MLQLKKHRRVLLVPAAPSEALLKAVSTCGIALHRYDFRVEDDAVTVEFPAEFIALFGPASPA
ncbi:MAG: hypothetical protein EON58_20980 [Alphaproteobacteria bacterium]|nr:MAG: hypothetical protein EON58_20980 [Alphaproteobacteria bacterium]